MRARAGRQATFAAMLLAVLAATPALADCRLEALPGVGPGGGIPMRMVVVANTPCLQQIAPHAEGRVESARITRRPRHGRAGLAGNNDFAYTPAADFVGRDNFEVTLTANANGQRRAGRFHFDVEVVR